MLSGMLNVHFGILLGVHHGRNGDTEVGDGAPEVCSEALLANPVVLYILNSHSEIFSSIPIHLDLIAISSFFFAS